MCVVLSLIREADMQIRKRARGMILLPWLFWIAFTATVGEFGYMFYNMACTDCTFRGSGDGGDF